MTYVGAECWDRYFRKLGEAGDDLDWEGRRTDPFLVPLREAEAQTVLEPVEITDRETGESFKRVWRGVAHRWAAGWLRNHRDGGWITVLRDSLADY